MFGGDHNEGAAAPDSAACQHHRPPTEVPGLQGLPPRGRSRQPGIPEEFTAPLAELNPEVRAAAKTFFDRKATETLRKVDFDEIITKIVKPNLDEISGNFDKKNADQVWKRLLNSLRQHKHRVSAQLIASSHIISTASFFLSAPHPTPSSLGALASLTAASTCRLHSIPSNILQNNQQQNQEVNLDDLLAGKLRSAEEEKSEDVEEGKSAASGPSAGGYLNDDPWGHFEIGVSDETKDGMGNDDWYFKQWQQKCNHHNKTPTVLESKSSKKASGGRHCFLLILILLGAALGVRV